MTISALFQNLTRAEGSS